MFNVTVAAKFSTHAKIKYTQLQLVSSGLMYVKKIHQFLSNIKKTMDTKENWFPFSASRCTCKRSTIVHSVSASRMSYYPLSNSVTAVWTKLDMVLS